MKNMFESPAVMEAYGAIDMCLMALKMINNKFDKKGSTGINKMIDNVTGYAEAEFKNDIDTGIELLRIVIENKEFIEADCSKERELLEVFKSFR